MVAGTSLSIFGNTAEIKSPPRSELYLTPETKASARIFLHKIVDGIISKNLQRAGNSDVYHWTITVVFDEGKFTREAAPHHQKPISSHEVPGTHLVPVFLTDKTPKPFKRFDSTAVKPFRNDVWNYVKSIQVRVVLPESAPVSLREAIRFELASNADLSLPANVYPDKAITVVTDHHLLVKLDQVGIRFRNFLNACIFSARSFQYWPNVVAFGIGCLLLLLVGVAINAFKARQANNQANRNHRLQYLGTSLNSLNKRQLLHLKHLLSDTETTICAYVLPLERTNDFLDENLSKEFFSRIERLNCGKISPRILSRIFEKIEKTGSERC